MKKILAVLVVIAAFFTMSAPSAFAAAGKAVIPYWQHGYGMYTFFSVTSFGMPQGNSVDFTSTSATITITLTATDTGGNYTISPTTGAGAATGSSGQTFATATFTAGGQGTNMLVDTQQIGNQASASVVWTTGNSYLNYSTTSGKLGFGTITNSTGATNNFKAWGCVYGVISSVPTGFTVDIGSF